MLCQGSARCPREAVLGTRCVKHFLYKRKLGVMLYKFRWFRRIATKLEQSLDVRYMMIRLGEPVPPPEIVLEFVVPRYRDKYGAAVVELARLVDRRANEDRSRNEEGGQPV